MADRSPRRLALAVLLGGAAACSVFGADPTPSSLPPDAGVGAPSDASAAGDAARRSGIVYRSGSTFEATVPPGMPAPVPMPEGLVSGDLLWAVVAFDGNDGALDFRGPASGWRPLRTLTSHCVKQNADHTVHHFVRFVATDIPKSEILASGSSTLELSIAVAAYSGVDPTAVIETAIVDVKEPGPLTSPTLLATQPNAQLLLAFTHLGAFGGQWFPIAGMELRRSSGDVGIYDAPSALGMVPSRTAGSTVPDICGATALAALLPGKNE